MYNFKRSILCVLLNILKYNRPLTYQIRIMLDPMAKQTGKLRTKKVGVRNIRRLEKRNDDL